MENILKKQITVLPIIFGNRLADNDELNDLCFLPPFYELYPFLIVEFWNRGYHNFPLGFKFVKNKVAKIIENDQDSLAVFIILNDAAAKEARAWLSFIKELKTKRENIFVYPVVWGSGYVKSEKDKGDTEYLCNSGQAARIHFNGDAKSAGARRMSEYMSRIMGNDLESDLFPEYGIETARKIAEHINWENFNLLTPKSGSISKYPFRDGKPYFPILSIDVNCPECGKKRTVYRTQLDEKGGATIRCYSPKLHDIYLEKIGEKFDPWPEMTIQR